MLPLGNSPVEVVVRPAPVAVEGAEIVGGRAGEASPTPATQRGVDDVVTFAGKATGSGDSEVRLTITDAWLRGYVLTDDEWSFIEPLRKFRLDAGFDEYVAYRTRDLRFKLHFGEDYKPRKVEGAEPGGLNPPHRVNPIVPLAMVHDEQYSWAAGGRPYDYQRALINDVNGLFSRIGCEFRIRVFIWTVNWLTSTNADRMLDQVEDAVRTLWTDLRPAANRRSFNTETAHATTGKELDGSTIRPGLAAGGLRPFAANADLDRRRRPLWRPPNLAVQNMLVAAHELGHSFNSAHEEGDEWCVAPIHLVLGLCPDSVLADTL